MIDHPTSQMVGTAAGMEVDMEDILGAGVLHGDV
jgi:hypothetical protein